MNAAFDYFATLQMATKGDKTHNGRFEDNKRINKFEANMQKWGRRLTMNGCDCGNATTIRVYTSQINISSNPIG